MCPGWAMAILNAEKKLLANTKKTIFLTLTKSPQGAARPASCNYYCMRVPKEFCRLRWQSRLVLVEKEERWYYGCGCSCGAEAGIGEKAGNAVMLGVVVVAAAVAGIDPAVIAVAAVVPGWRTWVCMGERECTVLAPGGWVYCRMFVMSSTTAL